MCRAGTSWYRQAASTPACGPSSTPCGCCAGTEALTPEMVANRPGLSALTYRVGTHATFLETMLARLSTMQVEHDGQTYRPLGDLATRDADVASAIDRNEASCQIGIARR